MSGSSGTGLSGDTFVGENGDVQWRALALTVFGGIVTAVGIGAGAVSNALFQLPISLANAVASFGSDVVSGLFGTAIGWASLAWSIPTGIVEGLTGLWVPVATLALAFTVLYIVGWSDD